jgi:D-arabinose 1-dehydrogenase-like Zn-dependent alcohol dehydrogenase
MSKMRAIQISKPHGSFELVERDIPTPSAGTVRIKIQACGICHSDAMVKDGLFPNIQYPKIPGHEVAGVIDALGDGVTDWSVGQRVGVGWYGGHCNSCEACRRGQFILCAKGKIPGITFDGGYAEYMIAPKEALALIPEELSAIEAAPLLCAGITTFNALRNSCARPGDTVAVLGIGGLGHLGIQFCAKMGFNTVAIARGKDKEPLAKQLGAKHYIDSQSDNIAKELQKFGGAKVILSTVTNNDAISPAVGGLSNNGELIIVGVPFEPIKISALSLIQGNRSVKGWASGTSIDSQDTMNFSALTGVRSMNQTFPLEKVEEAYQLMLSGKARFRVVLVTEHAKQS